MKALVLLLLLCCADVVLSEMDQMSDVALAQRDCFELLHPPQQFYEEYKNMEVPDHVIAARYLECLIEKLNLYSEEKGVFVDDIMQQISRIYPQQERLVKRAFTECLMDEYPEHYAEKNTWVSKVFQCFVNKSKKMHLNRN